MGDEQGALAKQQGFTSADAGKSVGDDGPVEKKGEKGGIIETDFVRAWSISKWQKKQGIILWIEQFYKVFPAGE